MTDRPLSAAAAIIHHCTDLNAAIAEHEAGGYRLDMIMPADRPRQALMSGADGLVRLESRQAAPAAPEHPPGLWVSRIDATDAWPPGRAGMQYRDLIPSRMGGRYIASHIRIPDGGPVNDYVHFHRIGFQLIYCRRGWVRVVYEDQGPPFVLHAGDCVLQPPTIRHRVLEASPGLEVIEVASPAEHETWRDHTLSLPTDRFDPARDFGGQRFIRHIAAEAPWTPGPWLGFEYRDTGLDVASRGAVSVKVLRTSGNETMSAAQPHALALMHLLAGELELRCEGSAPQVLHSGDTAVLPTGGSFAIGASSACEVLWVTAS